MWIKVKENGQTVEVSTSTGGEMIAQGYAEAASEPKSEKAEAKKAEADEKGSK